MKDKGMKKVFAICGSTRIHSANLQILEAIKAMTAGFMEVEIFRDLDKLPHFNPDDDDPVEIVSLFRNKIERADGILICTPEYVFSLPGSLKNAIEWTVSTTIFSDKPVAVITASGLGEKAHESLQLIMKTVGASFTEQTQLLIQGARSKLNDSGEITDGPTLKKIKELIHNFTTLMNNPRSNP